MIPRARQAKVAPGGAGNDRAQAIPFACRTGGRRALGQAPAPGWATRRYGEAR
jgi:hypothetical protein